jgi:GNAT superfamily N-acetyltransferase
VPELPNAREFIGGVAAAMGLGERVHRPGTTVVAAEARAGSSTVVAYAIAAHTVLWCDPALATDLAPFAHPSISASLADIDSALAGMNWTDAGASRMLLPRADGLERPPRRDERIRAMDLTDPDDVALIDAFRAGLSAEDRDEADLDEELDDHFLAIVDARGIAAFASQHPFDIAPRFGDIAVATRDDVRGRGLGRLVVAELAEQILARGLVPLYRHDLVNAGSARLCDSLGFVPLVHVSATSRL